MATIDQYYADIMSRLSGPSYPAIQEEEIKQPEENFGAEMIKALGAPLLALAGGESGALAAPRLQEGINKMDQNQKEMAMKRSLAEQNQKLRMADQALRRQAAEERLSFGDKRLESERELARERMASQKDIAGQRIDVQQAKEARRREEKGIVEGEADYLPGYSWNKKTPIYEPEVNKMQKAVADKQSLTGLIDTIKDEVSNASDSELVNPLSEKSKKIKGYLRDAQLLYKGPAFAELGVLAGPDLDILEQVLEAPGLKTVAASGGKQALLARYEEAKKRVENRLSNTLAMRGFQKAGQSAAPQAAPQAAGPEVKMIGGVPYQKTEKGWVKQ
jgi:hypothetical protein